MRQFDAKAAAWDNQRTVADLLALCAGARATAVVSKVNPGLSKAQACDVLSAALAGREPTEVPKGWRFDAMRRRNVLSRDGRLIVNILRECL